MKNNFLIVSDDKIIIDSKIAKILSDIGKKNLEIVKLDMSCSTISNLIEELDTYNFLSECKLIICYGCSFIEGESNKEIKYLKKYLAAPSDNYLIMISSKISEKKEIKELLSTNVEIITSSISTEVLIKNNLKEYKIDNRTVKYFSEYCLGNNEKILNEIEKIKCYKNDESSREVTIEDINKIVLKDYNEDIFNLVNAIAKRDTIKAFDIYGRISQKEKDSVNIIASISSQLRLLYNVTVLSNDKMNISEMASLLNVKPRAVSIALENCHNFSSKKLLSLLDELAEIDYKTKSGSVSGHTLLKIFMMNI